MSWEPVRERNDRKEHLASGHAGGTKPEKRKLAQTKKWKSPPREKRGRSKQKKVREKERYIGADMDPKGTGLNQKGEA